MAAFVMQVIYCYDRTMHFMIDGSLFRSAVIGRPN